MSEDFAQEHLDRLEQETADWPTWMKEEMKPTNDDSAQAVERKPERFIGYRNVDAVDGGEEVDAVLASEHDALVARLEAELAVARSALVEARAALAYEDFESECDARDIVVADFDTNYAIHDPEDALNLAFSAGAKWQRAAIRDRHTRKDTE